MIDKYDTNYFLPATTVVKSSSLKLYGELDKKTPNKQQLVLETGLVIRAFSLSVNFDQSDFNTTDVSNTIVCPGTQQVNTSKASLPVPLRAVSGIGFLMLCCLFSPTW